MKCIAIGLDVAAFVLGVAAAWFWFKASQVTVPDSCPQDGIPRETKIEDFVLPTIKAFADVGWWNKVAALLTALTVLIGGLGNLAALWPL